MMMIKRKMMMMRRKKLYLYQKSIKLEVQAL
jgi:hypothetical protein